MHASKRAFASILAVSSAISGASQCAQARPLYMRGFSEQYPKIEPLTREAKCSVCHCKEEKRAINLYGEAIGKALKAKNVKNRDVISKAIVEAEEAPSRTPATTFGDLIMSGRLPAPCDEKVVSATPSLSRLRP